MVICLLLAAAAVLWPLRRGRLGPDRREGRIADRSAVPQGPSVTAVAARSHRYRPLLGCGALGLIGWSYVLAGPVGVVAAGVLLATGGVLVTRALSDRRRHAALVDLLAGLRMLGRELRAGADPAAAAENARAAARGDGALVLAALAQLARADDRFTGVPAAERSTVGAGGSDGSPRVQVLERLRSGWLLTQRHGLALTPLIEALTADLAQQLAADSERSGQVAGPRTSGWVMALLPLMGLALGVGMGADPIRVLLTTGIGRVLLLVGVSLTCAGLLWSARIVRR